MCGATSRGPRRAKSDQPGRHTVKRKYLVRATRGEMEVRVRGLTESARTVYSIGRQIIYTAIGLAAGVAALQLHFHGEDRAARIAGYVAGGAFSLLVLASIFGRPRRR